MKHIQSDFEKKLSKLVTAELERVWGNEHEINVLLESLAFSVAYTICLTRKGEKREIDATSLRIEHYIGSQTQILADTAKEWVKTNKNSEK